MERRFALTAVLVASTGCRAPAPPTIIANHARASEACERFTGTIHDLDDDNAPAAGATVVAAGIANREDVALSDRHGWFVFDDLSQAQRKVTVFYKDLAFTNVLPSRRCWPVWLGVHGSTQRFETPLVIR